MAYEPHTWECNEVITEEKMNHIEQGIADASVGVTIVQTTYDADSDCELLNITPNEALNLMSNGGVILVNSPMRDIQGNPNGTYFAGMVTRADDTLVNVLYASTSPYIRQYMATSSDTAARYCYDE